MSSTARQSSADAEATLTDKGRAIMRDERGLTPIHWIGNVAAPSYFSFIEWIIVTGALLVAARELGDPVVVALALTAYLLLIAHMVSRSFFLLAHVATSPPMVWAIRLARFLPKAIQNAMPATFATVTMVIWFIGINWALVLMLRLVDALAGAA